MHMELQWTVWMPWTFWALHRTLEHAAVLRRYRRADRRLRGAAAPVEHLLRRLSRDARRPGRRPAALRNARAAPEGLRWPRWRLARCWRSCSPRRMRRRISPRRQQLGGRSEEQVLTFSAPPSSYTVATDGNYLYGERSAPRGRPERRLFPGILAVLLAVVGLLLRQPSAARRSRICSRWPPRSRCRWALYGYSFSFLYRHVPVFDALRAPARLGIFVVFFLAVLAAWGHAAVEAALPRTGRRALAAAICGVLLLEYWVAPLRLVPLSKRAAAAVCVARAAAARRRRRIPDARARGAPGRRGALCVYVDVPLDAERERLQRVLPSVLPRADRQAARVSRRRFDRCAAARRRTLRRSSISLPTRRTAPDRYSPRSRTATPVIHAARPFHDGAAIAIRLR